ncbi:MAG: hypothetical protein V3V29_10620 [Acidimicrobiia bacterium]
MNVNVSRSPLRLLTYAILSVPAILLAIDMTVSHKWISAPETTDVVVGQSTDENGQQVDVTKAVLTDVGRAERRRDLLFGAALFIGGALAMAWSIKELARPTAFLTADDDGLLVRLDGPRRPPLRFTWDGIVEVRSGIVPDDGVEVPVLSIRLLDMEEVPYRPAGAHAEPPWLHLLAEEWDTPAHQIAPLFDQMAARTRPTREHE